MVPYNPLAKGVTIIISYCTKKLETVVQNLFEFRGARENTTKIMMLSNRQQLQITWETVSNFPQRGASTDMMPPLTDKEEVKDEYMKLEGGLISDNVKEDDNWG
jgi:hypothetical protein